MELEWGAAALSGLVAGMIMAMPVVLAHPIGMRLALDMPKIWGSWARTSLPAQGLGLVVHAAVSVLVGLLYAAAFNAVGVDHHLAAWGVLGGFVHWLIAGAVLTGIAAAHPGIPSVMPDPGAYCRHLGRADVGVFLVAHLLYGLAFGCTYALLNAHASLT